jgi:hypothetical protein
MYQTQGKAELFTAGRTRGVIDVIPIERGMKDKASMLFKEATRHSVCACCFVRMRAYSGFFLVRRGVGAAHEDHRR